MCGISNLMSEYSQRHRESIGRLPIARFQILVGVTMACAATLMLGIGPAQARDSRASTAQIIERLDALERENNELRAEVRQQREELHSVTQKMEATTRARPRKSANWIRR